MKILIVGSGAREDALSWALAQSPSCTALFAAPGNAGTATRGQNWAIPATDGKALAGKCIEAGIDLAIIGPETALAAGVADRLREAGIPTFGPNRSAARLETSKIFAKRFLERHGIPTGRSRVVRSFEAGRKVLEDWRGPCVVKADGLAAGKGVVVAPDAGAARAVLFDWYEHNRIPGGGTDVVLEEFLAGREVSVFALCDGTALVPVAAACDYKRAGDGDSGPNTGGMGAYSPPAGFPGDYLDVIRARIIEPVMRGLAADDERYVGVLYCGLMWTADGPKVIEFNVRFGDPETQVIMPRVRGDLARLLRSVADGAADLSAADFSGDPCVGVVLATRDYPLANTPVELDGSAIGSGSLAGGAKAFWGTTTRKGELVSASGGRVLTVSGSGATVEAARAAAYAALGRLAELMGAGSTLSFRTDIAAGLRDAPAPPRETFVEQTR